MLLNRLNLFLLSTAAVLLSGCGAYLQNAATTVSVPSFTGSVHGGQQPVSGAVVRVMMPGQIGYGSAPSVLSTSATDANGTFSMPAYTCPVNSGLLYLTVNGGNSGAGVNALLAEAAVLGPCSAALQSSFVRVTEVTTIAAAHALAPFANVSVTGTNIGTSATNLTGLNNTFAVTNLLAPNTTGFASQGIYTPNQLVPAISYPTAEINTLANIIASCINTAGVTSPGSACATLLTNTTYNNVTPVDTFQAAINMARQPMTNVSALYNLSASNAPFQPQLAFQPLDLNLLIGFAGTVPAANTPAAGTGNIALDAQGDVYTLSASALVKIAPGGAITSTTLAGQCSAANLAVNTEGSIFVTCSGGSLQTYNAAGTLLSNTTPADFTSTPYSPAFDAAGNLWVGTGSGLAEYNTAGTEAAGSPYPLGLAITDVAIGPSAIWGSTGYSSKVARVDNTTHALLSFAETPHLTGLAVDSSNNLWNGSYYLDQSSYTYGTALELNNSGAAVSPANGYPGTYARAQPQGIALDGLGSAYTANSTQHPINNPAVVVSYSPTGAIQTNGVTPYTETSTLTTMTPTPNRPAFDASGNLWVSGPFGAGGYVTMVVGLGAPVVTPLATATASNKVATRP